MNVNRGESVMTSRQTDRWIVVLLAVALLSGRIVAQEAAPPEKKAADKAPEERKVDPNRRSGDAPRPEAGRRSPFPDFFGQEDRPPDRSRRPEGPADGRNFPPGRGPEVQPPGFGRSPGGFPGGRGGPMDPY